jgi:hypothetical protein
MIRSGGSLVASITRNRGHLEGIHRDVEMYRIVEWQMREGIVWRIDVLLSLLILISR